MVAVEIGGVVEKIGRGLILGSTEAAEYVLKSLEDIIASSKNVRELKERLVESIRTVYGVRPTSALLTNSFRDILLTFKNVVRRSVDIPKIKEFLLLRIAELLEEAKGTSEKAASIAAKRLSDEEVILTVGYSKTVIRTVEYAVEEGKDVKVIVAESRPKMDGVKVAQSLSKIGVGATLIIDSAIRFFMKNVSKVLVGAEAISANGALINKVGTSIAALAAHEARVRVFVVSSSLKISPETVFGELIEIPEAPLEQLILEGEVGGLEGLKVEAPLYDVTPPEYIDAIITERGVFAPQAVSLVIKEIYGSWPPKVPELRELIEEVEKHEV